MGCSRLSPWPALPNMGALKIRSYLIPLVDAEPSMSSACSVCGPRTGVRQNLLEGSSSQTASPIPVSIPFRGLGRGSKNVRVYQLQRAAAAPVGNTPRATVIDFS